MKAYLGTTPPPKKKKKNSYNSLYCIYWILFAFCLLNNNNIHTRTVALFYVDRIKYNIIYAQTTMQLGARNFQLRKRIPLCNTCTGLRKKKNCRDILQWLLRILFLSCSARYNLLYTVIACAFNIPIQL